MKLSSNRNDINYWLWYNTLNMTTDPTTLDRNTVAGFFYYLNDTNELDVEYSQWGDPAANNTQYSVQDGDVSPLYKTSGTNNIQTMIWYSNEWVGSCKQIYRNTGCTSCQKRQLQASYLSPGLR